MKKTRTSSRFLKFLSAIISAVCDKKCSRHCFFFLMISTGRFNFYLKPHDSYHTGSILTTEITHFVITTSLTITWISARQTRTDYIIVLNLNLDKAGSRNEDLRTSKGLSKNPWRGCMRLESFGRNNWSG